MDNQKVYKQIEEAIKNSKNWFIYHHTHDNLGNPALMIFEENTDATNFGVNINVFKGHAYLFMDNGTPAEPGDSYSIQDIHDFEALEELLEIIKPFIKK